MRNVCSRLRSCLSSFFTTIRNMADWKNFFKSVLLWGLGIAFGFVPLIFKMFLSWLENRIIIDIWIDPDIAFCNFNTSFLLLLEAILGEDKECKKAVIVLTLLMMTVCGSYYTAMVFYPNWNMQMPTVYTVAVNSVLFFLVISIGVICFFNLSKH